MRLRDFAPGDLAEGIHGPSHEGTGWGPRGGGDGWQRTLVAEDCGDVLGMGTMLVSNVHRESYYCEVQVEPEARREGVGRALFDALLACTPTPYPVLTRAMSSQPAREAFARAMGFEVLMRCPSPQLHPSSLATAHWIEQHPVPPGVRVVPASERSYEEFLDAWVDLYVWIHEEWSPTVDRAIVHQLFAASGMAEVDFELTRVAIVDGRIAALACVLPDPWDNRSFLVTETVRRRLGNGTDILAATIGSALQACAERGITFVEFDGHVVDPHYYPLAQTLPITGSDPLLVMRHPGRNGAERSSADLRRPVLAGDQLR
ncbi:GNAT family N-acetyltransferase [Microlunatus ginsengisoli]|uniref:N-acetyltransferase domain-containing protein n=1 Tax=Microlunatus ginsengisoli TaxID=363863 RepID=A0ABP7AT85_9ACTN